MQIKRTKKYIYSNMRSARKFWPSTVQLIEYTLIGSKCTRKNGPPRKGQDTVESPMSNSFVLSWNHMYKNTISIL